MDIRMKKPSHPGLFIRREILEANTLSIIELAAMLNVDKEYLKGILEGEIPITKYVAGQIEKIYSISANTLLKMQISYNRSIPHIAPKIKDVFGKQLKIAREHRKISLEEMANICKFSLSTLKDFENGNRLPSIQHFQTIIYVLRIPSEHFFYPNTSLVHYLYIGDLSEKDLDKVFEFMKKLQFQILTS